MARQSEVKVKFSVFNEEYKKGMEEINQANSKMKNEMKLTETQMKHSSTETEKLEHKVKRLGNEKENVGKKIELTEKQLEKAKEMYGENSEEADKLANDLVKLQTSEQRLENAIIDTNQEIEAQQAAMSDTSSPEKYKKSLEEVGQATQEIGQKVQDAGKTLNDFGNWYSTRVTAPIVAGGAAVFKASMDFESAFANFRKVTDATEEEFATFNQAFRDLAKVIPVSTEEIANTAAAASQLGIEKENVLGFTENMLAMGVASDMTSETAAFAFARLANITGMAQDDFDRLGSTVVDLGNNFAATESEIANMALRIAGAGSQINMSEADILGFSTALSSVGIRAEMGGSAISKLMINMAASVEMGGEDLKEFARIAGMSVENFRKAFEEDAATAIFTFLGGLGDLSEQGESAFKIIDDLGMSEIRLRDTILRSSNASEMATSALKTANEAWAENSALQNEAAERYATTESQLIMMWNRIKDVAITLGNALVPAVMGALDAMEPFFEKIEDVANGFAEMDEEQQRNILKLIALVAAVGPAAKVLGGLFTVIGGGIKIVGSLTTAIGATKGAGLVARLVALAPVGGPVALAIAGITGLGVAIYNLTKDTDKATEVNLDMAQSLIDQHKELEAAAEGYSKLRDESKLTTKEFGELLDIRKEMASNPEEEAFKELEKRYEELRKKSGMSNEQLDKMIGYNQVIVENAPQTAEAHSAQGEAIAGVNEKLEDHIRLLHDMAVEEIELEHAKWLVKRSELLDTIKDSELEIEQINKRLLGLDELNALGKDGIEARLDEISNQYFNQENTQEELKRLDEERIYLTGVQNEGLAETRVKLLEQRNEHLGIIDATKEELELGKEVESLYAEIHLDKLNINEAGQEGVDIAKKQLDEKIKERDLLNEQLGKEEHKDAILREQLDVLNKQIGDYQSILGLINDTTDLNAETLDKERKRQDVVKQITDDFREQRGALGALKSGQEENNRTIKQGEENAKKMNDELKKDVKKDVEVTDNGTAKKVHDEAVKPATKSVTLNAAWTGVQAGLRLAMSTMRMPAYAKGTDHHPGGPALLGDGGGPELVREGRKWSIADLGVYNLQRGAQVFTHEQSLKIVKGIKNLPAYASGVGVSGALAAQLNQLSLNVASTLPNPMGDRQINIEASDVILEGRVVGQIIWRPVKEHIDRSNGRASKMPRGR
ncbi:phage tail tape measure protein [Alkalihalobacillus pseudalcaliphilus]|uniref:phage tail tape measure protein n=1 Tax=Alkalihalobacillus pseudalcaliphilus TaxID=79884 RepID=UPI00069EA504|nr:phage tail tape measure protein [Alkalihalobacillus pseudalcaliphilus]